MEADAGAGRRRFGRWFCQVLKLRPEKQRDENLIADAADVDLDARPGGVHSFEGSLEVRDHSIAVRAVPSWSAGISTSRPLFNSRPSFRTYHIAGLRRAALQATAIA